MKSLLFQLGILAAIISPFVLPFFVAGVYFELEYPLPLLAGITGFGFALWAFIEWNRREQARTQAILETLSYPILGEVICRHDLWEATMTGKHGSLPVNGQAPRPTEQQRQTALAVMERLPDLLEASTEAARDVMRPEGQDVTSSDLKLEIVSLDESELGSFSIVFELPRFDQLLPWGLTVEFVDYQVVDAEAFH